MPALPWRPAVILLVLATLDADGEVGITDSSKLMNHVDQLIHGQRAAYISITVDQLCDRVIA
ncbi:hypothetical protein D3C76_1467540 [compost metagenome]